jgi:hypothetical protein
MILKDSGANWFLQMSGLAMVSHDEDEETLGKMLEAAAEIKNMARSRPAEAPAMLEQAQHLIELAEQIRSDWLRRRNDSRLDAASALGADRRGRASGTY